MWPINGSPSPRRTGCTKTIIVSITFALKNSAANSPPPTSQSIFPWLNLLLFSKFGDRFRYDLGMFGFCKRLEKTKVSSAEYG